MATKSVPVNSSGKISKHHGKGSKRAGKTFRYKKVAPGPRTFRDENQEKTCASLPSEIRTLRLILQSTKIRLNHIQEVAKALAGQSDLLLRLRFLSLNACDPELRFREKESLETEWKEILNEIERLSEIAVFLGHGWIHTPSYPPACEENKNRQAEKRDDGKSRKADLDGEASFPPLTSTFLELNNLSLQTPAFALTACQSVKAATEVVSLVRNRVSILNSKVSQAISGQKIALENKIAAEAASHNLDLQEIALLTWA